MSHIVIIGNGIAGVTAARHLRKRGNNNITIISSETEYFFSRTALMYIYMGHMKFENTKPYEDWFWKKNKIDLVYDYVSSVNTENNKLHCRSGREIFYDILILATGSQPNKFGWPGQNLQGVQGLYSFQDLQLMEQNSKGIKKAVIVGGGLIGIEMAEMLLSRKIDVTFLVREKEFWSNVLPMQEAKLISHHVRSHHVDLRLDTELLSIQDDGTGKVKSIVTSKNETIDCQLVGLTVGVSPSIAFLKDSTIKTNRGVLVNEFLQTNIDNVYAIGDCVQRTYEIPGRRNIEQVWFTGRMMGEVVAQTISGQVTKYEPGPWFNSAKFFDIEYHTYGNVGAQLKENESEFYWEHSSKRKAIHFIWDTTSKQFIGVNSFGIRLRHEKFDQWLREQRGIDFVIRHLKEANFDPEFFKRHESEITQAFENKFPELLNLSLK